MDSRAVERMAVMGMALPLDRLDSYHIMTVYLVAYALAYPLGAIVSNWLTGKRMSRQPFFVRLPVYLSTGLALLVVAYFTASLIAVSAITIALVAAIAWLLFAGVTLRSKWANGYNVQFRQSLGVANLVPLLLLLLPLFFFAASIEYMKWPPIGDIAEAHGPLVALIQYQGSLPMTLDPLVENVLPAYPLGYHVFVATLNSLFNYYPAQIVLISGGLIIALIPSLVYSIVFIRGKSVVFAGISYAFVYLVYPANLERWIVGYFYNGPYPNLLGYLIILSFVCLLVSMGNAEALTWNEFGRISLLTFIVGISLLLVYPGFASFVVAYLVTLSLFHLATIQREASKALRAVTKLGIARSTLFFLGGALLLCLGVSLLFVYLSMYVPSFLLTRPGTLIDLRAFELVRQSYAVPPSFFVDNVNGMMTLVASVVATYLVVNRRDLTLSLFFLTVFIPVDLSLFQPFFSWLAYLQPSRSVIIDWVLAWPIIFAALSIVLRDRNKAAIG